MLPRKQLYLKGNIITPVKGDILTVPNLLGYFNYGISILPSLNNFAEKNGSVSK